MKIARRKIGVLDHLESITAGWIMVSSRILFRRRGGVFRKAFLVKEKLKLFRDGLKWWNKKKIGWLDLGMAIEVVILRLVGSKYPQKLPATGR